MQDHDPNGIDQHQVGAKLDANKPRCSLVLGGFSLALEQVAIVGTFGAKKYTDNGWQFVSNGTERYTDALYRHLLAEAGPSKTDPDSGLLHASHAAWNALARLELMLRNSMTNHVNTDYRALCAELVQIADALDGKSPSVANQGQSLDGFAALANFRQVANRARAALAEPDGPAVQGREPAAVVGEPSDEELLATLDKATATFPPRHPEAEALNAVKYPLALELRKARAVLARWGHHSPDATKMVGPAEGEVAELVAWLRGANWDSKRQTLATRAADLLEQRHPVPVPVSERLPEAGDCDEGGRCWCFCTEYPGEWPHWIFGTEVFCGPTHWLPAHALPLPQGEVQP